MDLSDIRAHLSWHSTDQVRMTSARHLPEWHYYNPRHVESPPESQIVYKIYNIKVQLCQNIAP